MERWIETLRGWLSPDLLADGSKALVILVAGLLLARLLSAAIARVLRTRPAGQVRVLRRLVFWIVLMLFVASALNQLGFKLGVLFGAAGVLTVAVGFASQTSASNLISGLFLLIEEPFAVGDTIKVGDTTGEVVSIDLLSAKLRTFDNNFVRIPNETLIKSEVATLTKFPIRRIDLKVPVDYGADLAKTRELLFAIADEHPLALEEPEPVFFCLGFADSAIDLQFSVWTARENYVPLRTTLYQTIKARFAEEGIEIPFPQRTVHIKEKVTATEKTVGSATGGVGDQEQQSQE